MTPPENLSKAVSILKNAAERIRNIEHEAQEALYLRDDPEAYRQKLQEKTMLLMELPEMVAPYYEGMPEDIRAELETELSSFAMRAEQAWGLSSIFYMSALLYPETYKEGDMNDLELFIDRLP
ncbi:MAG: hypothetical protein AB9866_24340 [Syntrophobacteraceae bacterium]